jgi:hypothetical protein
MAVEFYELKPYRNLPNQGEIIPMPITADGTNLDRLILEDAR